MGNSRERVNELSTTLAMEEDNSVWQLLLCRYACKSYSFGKPNYSLKSSLVMLPFETIWYSKSLSPGLPASRVWIIIQSNTVFVSGMKKSTTRIWTITVRADESGPPPPLRRLRCTEYRLHARRWAALVYVRLLIVPARFSTRHKLTAALQSAVRAGNVKRVRRLVRQGAGACTTLVYHDWTLSTPPPFIRSSRPVCTAKYCVRVSGVTWRDWRDAMPLL